MDLDTGHSGIDKQHQVLNQLGQSLDSVCVKQGEGEICQHCPCEHSSECNDRLAELLSELLSFMLDHFAYEEKLMNWLPETEECQTHIREHKYAHAEVSRLLSELTTELDLTSARQSAIHLKNIIGVWLGQHAEHYDSKLMVSLGGAYDVELNYDRELSRLLSV